MVKIGRLSKPLAVAAAMLLTPISASADPGCGLSEVARFQTAVARPAEEATPAYLKRTAEAFIASCPDRFETREAHLIAARSAMDAGSAIDAIAHYENAETRGARLSPAQRLDQSVALLAAGKERAAVEARNIAVGEWLDKLTADGSAKCDVRKSRGGVILAVSFPQQGREEPVRAVWLAVPDGPGLPAAAVLRPDPMRSSLRALRTGREVGSLTVLEHRTCQNARVLRETQQPAAIASFDHDASEAMRQYLRNPEGLTTTAPGEPLASCLMPELMMHVPEPTY